MAQVVTIFIIDVSSTMGRIREVAVERPNGEKSTTEMTNLHWALQYVKTKVQEKIFRALKTDHVGVLLVGTEETENIVNAEHEGEYMNVTEYIPLDMVNAGTIGKIDAIEVTDDAESQGQNGIIVAIQTQTESLGGASSKKSTSWARKIVVITDGETAIDDEGWEEAADKLKELKASLVVVGIDFDETEDDSEEPFVEAQKSATKRESEEFYHRFVERVGEENGAVVGSCCTVLASLAQPDIKVTKSTLASYTLSIGDTEVRPDSSLAIAIRTSKYTAIARPSSWKKFARVGDVDEGDHSDVPKVAFAQVNMRTTWSISDKKDEDEDDVKAESQDVKMEDPGDPETLEAAAVVVPKEDLTRGYRYGTTYVPMPEEGFASLPTKKGMQICGFIYADKFRREHSMGEVQYVWADPAVEGAQLALSSMVQAMHGEDIEDDRPASELSKEELKARKANSEIYAIARWVTGDTRAPKMGILAPSIHENADCLLWVQMPFMDDIRKYQFGSLDQVRNKRGDVLAEHPYIPTKEQCDSADAFVDALDLSTAGGKDDEGNLVAWYDPRETFNPALHRIKQATLHSAIVSDVVAFPLPPPHKELTKYFEPPPLRSSKKRNAVEAFGKAMKVTLVPKKAIKSNKGGHAHANDDENISLSDFISPVAAASTSSNAEASSSTLDPNAMAVDTEKPTSPAPLQTGNPPPTPARSLSPRLRHASPTLDHGRAPGRLIGTTFPLKDFKENVDKSAGKAIEDLSAVVLEILGRPFVGRRMDELLQCVKTMRKVAVKLAESEGYNAFLKGLKAAQKTDSPSLKFWKRIVDEKTLGLIGSSEAEKAGGTSDVSDKEASRFFIL